MDLPTGTLIWKPEELETLSGAFHHVGGMNCAVRTEDGMVWLLEADAENQLEALGPDEGQLVRVSFRHESWPRSNYQVSLLSPESVRDEGSA
jgi:hypothetical protein